MKVQFSVYDSILASLVLVIFFLILYFSIPKISLEREKYIKFISYDILLAVDKIYRIGVNYENLKNIVSQILIDINFFPDFFISDFGLLKNEINISCICDKDAILLLNNIYRNISINGRNISINFFPTNFPLTQSDFERHGLIIFGCNENISNFQTDLKRYSFINGILFVCDIDQSYYNRHQLVLSQIFNLTTGRNNGNTYATLIKPYSAFLASYSAYKILRYQYNFSDGVNISLLNSSIVAVPRDNNMYLFRQQNSNIAAVTLTHFNKKIIGWSANFYRDKNIDDNEKKILLSLILSITSYKEPIILERYKKNLIPYISFHYDKFLEPFILYFSIPS